MKHMRNYLPRTIGVIAQCVKGFIQGSHLVSNHEEN